MKGRKILLIILLSIVLSAVTSAFPDTEYQHCIYDAVEPAFKK